MNIPKAIEILSQHQKGTDAIYLPGLPEAERLGIEALKDQLKARAAGWFPPGYKLPGETKD